MKTLGLAATLMLLGNLTLATADVSVDQQMAAIANASPQERVTLVNEFKERLATMNDEERASAISKMRSTMSSNDAKQTQSKSQTRQRARMGQMEQNQEMQQMQQMSQRQTGSQAMRQGTTGSGSNAGMPNKFMGHK